MFCNKEKSNAINEKICGIKTRVFDYKNLINCEKLQKTMRVYNLNTNKYLTHICLINLGFKKGVPRVRFPCSFNRFVLNCNPFQMTQVFLYQLSNSIFYTSNPSSFNVAASVRKNYRSRFSLLASRPYSKHLYMIVTITCY